MIITLDKSNLFISFQHKHISKSLRDLADLGNWESSVMIPFESLPLQFLDGNEVAGREMKQVKGAAGARCFSVLPHLSSCHDYLGSLCPLRPWHLLF